MGQLLLLLAVAAWAGAVHAAAPPDIPVQVLLPLSGEDCVVIDSDLPAVRRRNIAGHLGCILLKMSAISWLRTGA